MERLTAEALGHEAPDPEAGVRHGDGNNPRSERGNNRDAGLKLEVDPLDQDGTLDHGQGIDDQDDAQDLNNGLKLRLLQEFGDGGGRGEKDEKEGQARGQIVIEDGGIIGLSAVIFSYQGVAEAAIDERFGNGDEDHDHPNQAEFAGGEEPGQKDTDDKADPVTNKGVHKAPDQARYGLLFKGHECFKSAHFKCKRVHFAQVSSGRTGGFTVAAPSKGPDRNRLKNQYSEGRSLFHRWLAERLFAIPNGA